MTTLIFRPRLLFLYLGLITFPWLAPAAHAAGWDLTFRPRAEVGVAHYSLDFGSTAQRIEGFGLPVPVDVSTTKVEFSDTMPTLSAGLTVLVDRFYLDFYVQRAFNGSVTDSSYLSEGTSFSQLRSRVNYRGDIERDDYALALGYDVTENVAVFAGWKWSESSFDVRGTGITTTVDGTFLGVAETFGDYKFEYDGPFVGGNIGWPISSGALVGTLGLNVAVAFLDGKLRVSNDSSTVNGIPGFYGPAEVFDSSGSSIGTTIGLTWAGSTGVQGLSYSVGVNGYVYNFDADQTGKADISETFMQLKVGLAYTF